MTLPLMEAADETNKEDVWNFINKCSTFVHCPVSQGDYKRMLKFADNEALVDVVINTISKMGYPFSEEDRGDVVTYYYGIALISQSNYRRERKYYFIHIGQEKDGRRGQIGIRLLRILHMQKKKD